MLNIYFNGKNYTKTHELDYTFDVELIGGPTQLGHPFEPCTFYTVQYFTVTLVKEFERDRDLSETVYYYLDGTFGDDIEAQIINTAASAARRLITENEMSERVWLSHKRKPF